MNNFGNDNTFKLIKLNPTTMEELKQFISKNRMPVFVAISALLFIFISFCPILDILGKRAVNGFTLIAEGDGNQLAGPMLLTLLMILLSIAGIVIQFLPRKGKEFFPVIIYAACVVSCLFYWMTIPKGCSMAFGSVAYLITSIVGTFMASQDCEKQF